MKWQGLALVHNQRIFFHKLDRVFAEQVNLPKFADMDKSFVNGRGIHRFRQLALKAQNYGLVTAMTLAGGTERTV